MLKMFDLKTLQSLADIPVGAEGPDGIVYESTTDRVFAFEHKGKGLTIIAAHSCGLLGTACVTPCSLKASTGEHTISLSHAGFKTLTRPISVHDASFDLPVLTMSQALGTLMLQSDPPGATITIDDKRWPYVTPAPVSLPPGRYRLTVEKGSLKAVQTIEIRDGELRTLRLPLIPLTPQ